MFNNACKLKVIAIFNREVHFKVKGGYFCFYEIFFLTHSLDYSLMQNFRIFIELTLMPPF